jgi:hypothetical protein
VSVVQFYLWNEFAGRLGKGFRRWFEECNALAYMVV